MAKRKSPKELWRLTKMTLHVTMGLVYLFIGFLIIKKQWFMKDLQESVSYALGGVLVAYGVFRIYRIYSQNRND